MATTSKNNDEVDGKPGPGALFVKVSMDGAPYLRKVDLRTYSTYQELSTALEKMFSCFTLGERCFSFYPNGNMLLNNSIKIFKFVGLSYPYCSNKDNTSFLPGFGYYSLL